MGEASSKYFQCPNFNISLFRYAKDDDPDNPENYLAPDIEAPSVFGNLVPPPSAASSSTPAPAKETPKAAAAAEESSDLVGGELKPPGEEDEVPEEVQVKLIFPGYDQVNIYLTGGA